MTKVTEHRRLNLAERVLKYVGLDDSAQAEIRKGYSDTDELPPEVSGVLPEPAQEVWRNAYNWQYVDQELNHARAIESAWNEVRWFGYIKGSDGNYAISKRADGEIETLVKVVKVSTDDQRLVYGWANVLTKADGSAVNDSQGDVLTDPEDIASFEKSVVGYMLESRSGDEMHENFGVATIVESMFFTPEKVEKLGLPAGSLPCGWWVGYYVEDDNTWEGVKSGKYSMMSIVGTGTRSEL